MRTDPACGVPMPAISAARVDLPAPVAPTRASEPPAGIVRLDVPQDRLLGAGIA